MDQLSFASLDYAAKKKRTKRDVFLAEMATVVPWIHTRSFDRTILSEERSEWRAPTLSIGRDAADLLPVTVVQPLQSRRGEALYDIC